MLNLDAKEVDEKIEAGKTKDGRPVVYIYTKGGLHAFFTRKKKTSDIEPIGIGSHKAVAKWMAEKKEDIKWKGDFAKTEDCPSLIKSTDNKKRLNRLLNNPKVFKDSTDKSDTLIVKDWRSKEIILIKKEDLLLAVKNQIIGNDVIVRDLNMCTNPMTASEYSEQEGEDGRS